MNFNSLNYRRLITVLALLVCVSGCGLKGDLYLPEDEPQVVNATEQSETEKSEANKPESEEGDKTEKDEALHYQPTSTPQ